MREPPVAVVTPEAAIVWARADLLRAAGWSVTPSWELPADPFDLAAEYRACAAVIATRDDVAAAVLAAVRGAAVVAHCTEVALAELLVDDLARVTTVDAGAEAAPVALVLDEDQRRLLELLATGATINEAAAACYLSVRTAERRLAAARRALGVRTTAEALHAVSSRRP